MNSEEATHLLSDKSFLDKIYAFAYSRCRSSQEAEDLCSEIIVTVLRSLQREAAVASFYGYVWTIAHCVYADFCQKRSHADKVLLVEGARLDWMSEPASDAIGEWIETEAEKAKLQLIMKEISFLAKIYRDVMVMYYLDERSVEQIATRLQITPSAVKGRLFSARNFIRSEVDKMEATTSPQSLSLKPMYIQFIGTGNPTGNDPRVKAERVLSHNLVYLCRKQARSAKELSNLLHVPMPYIEDELAIQCRGENGSYGLLREVGGSKYIAGVLLLDKAEHKAASRIYEQRLDTFCTALEEELATVRDEILHFPYLSRQSNVGFILWTLISDTVWQLNEMVQERLRTDYFDQAAIPNRDFSVAGIAVAQGEPLHLGFYGRDGISSNHLCGYDTIHLTNLYGRRIQKHFGCGHNMSNDPLLMLTFRSIGGLSVESLTETERETAAKAIEAGYLKKQGDLLEPKIVTIRHKDEQAFRSLLAGIKLRLETISQEIAAELAALFRQTVPSHLAGEYTQFNMLAVLRLLNDTIEHAIARGLLSIPEERCGAEGILLVVKD